MTNPIQKINFAVSALKGVAHLAGDRDIRAYINVVRIEATATATRLIATDGHVAGVYERLEQNTLNTQSIALSVPTDIIKTLKAVRGADECTLMPEYAPPVKDGDEPKLIGGVISVYGGMSINFKTAGLETFPDYTRIIPKTLSGEAAQFNPDLITKFMKARKDIGNGACMPQIGFNGDNAALISLNIDDLFIGAAMPFRTEGKIKWTPTSAPAKFLTSLIA